MSNERAFYARERIKEEIDTKVNEACSFRPRLSSHSATASGVYVLANHDSASSER